MSPSLRHQGESVRPYYLDENATTLDDLRRRLQATDLIPSHQLLLEGIERTFVSLLRVGCRNIRDLRARLKSSKAVSALAEESRVDQGYLVLLRRVVEGFFPKPQPLTAFDWLDEAMLRKLAQAGVKDTAQLHLAAQSDLASLAKKTGLHSRELAEVVALADLSRVQWVSPTFARVLVAAGFDSAGKVARAGAEALLEAVAIANEGARFYKGKVGLRDFNRLATAASYVP